MYSLEPLTAVNSPDGVRGPLARSTGLCCLGATFPDGGRVAAPAQPGFRGAGGAGVPDGPAPVGRMRGGFALPCPPSAPASWAHPWLDSRGASGSADPCGLTSLEAIWAPSTSAAEPDSTRQVSRRPGGASAGPGQGELSHMVVGRECGTPCSRASVESLAANGPVSAGRRSARGAGQRGAPVSARRSRRYGDRACPHPAVATWLSG